MDFGDLQTVGAPHPLRVDFRAADHGDFSDETPQRIAGRDRAGVRERGCHDRAGAAKIGVAGENDIGSSGQGSAQRDEGLAAHHDRLAHGHRLEALQIGLQPPGYRPARADHAVVSYGHNEDDFH
ncbi:hypothetical protein GALL_544240 [mine drainage metagenome]|uniref:Uncharacterized protein n=1 Tax=mine drainage metagenome TaxID=410659 RepID=A0A1J5P973_9ZZZZ